MQLNSAFTPHKHRMKTNHLLIIDGIVWLIAGVNVVKLGVEAWIGLDCTTLLMVLGSLITLAAFSTMFVRMVLKNERRIATIPRPQRHVWNCMPLRSFLIMVFMITLGVTLRRSPHVPREFIAFFYVGLGLALSAAGIVYLALPLRRSKMP